MTDPTYALASSGGKDSTLALDRAQRRGLDVRYLLNIYEGSTDRVRFHGVRSELIRAQADALDLEIVQAPTAPEDFEAVFVETLDRLRRLGVMGVVFGNIHLDGVRAWYEERTTARGLRHVEPLWAEPPPELVRELVIQGYRAIVVSVDLEQAPGAWLGREIDLEFIREVEGTEGIDLCGERGEFHSFVYDGPLFHRPLPIEPGEAVEIDGHRFLDLVSAG